MKLNHKTRDSNHNTTRSVVGIGALFYSVNSNRCLYLLRSQKQKNTWGLVGGKQNAGECAQDTLYREFTEEIGSVPLPHKLIPIETFTSDDGYFKFITYVCVVPDEFVPVLNQEHHGYCWVQLGENPKPMHPGLWNTMNFAVIKQKIATLTNIKEWQFTVH
jgi:8-oxo-dGTP pyrophosphatase MutT (NUDIX family)